MTEEKRNFATHHKLVAIKDAEIIETIIGDVIDTFRNSTPAVNQECSKVEIKQYLSVSHARFDTSIMSF